MKIVTKDILKKIYKSRSEYSHKYDFGLLLVIGGSEFYTGSPALSAMAAFRTGVDMVYIIAPKRAADIIASFSPNLATYPLEGKWLSEKHLPVLFEIVESAKKVSNGKCAVVIGGGLGRSEETKTAIVNFLSQINVPVVIDADAIYAVSEKKEILAGKNFLITPHLYEFYVLTGKDISQKPDSEKEKILVSESKKLKTNILLKGKLDMIMISTKDSFAVNKVGHPTMTVGGTGDVLAGIAGALLARGVSIFDSACAAAFINGSAGERAAKKLGESMTATDLIGEIPNVIK